LHRQAAQKTVEVGDDYHLSFAGLDQFHPRSRSFRATRERRAAGHVYLVEDLDQI
jgi:hypothetical protein